MQEDSGLVGKNCSFGKGLFTTRAFRAGQVIAVVEGRHVREPNPEREEFYMDFGAEGVLEPFAPYRYLNHSCEPNCELQIEEFDDDVPEISIVALRRIKAGEQLSNDYGWPPTDPVPCFCGTPSCRDWIVSPEDLPRVRRKPLPMKQFPADFSQLLNASGRRLLASTGTAIEPTGGMSAPEALLTQTAARNVARLLSARFRDALRPRSCDASHDVIYMADLKGGRSRAGQLANASGLAAMLRGDSFHRFAEACCGQKLLRRPLLQLQCFEPGTPVARPRWLAGPASASSDIRILLSFSDGGGADNGFVTVAGHAAGTAQLPVEGPSRARRWILAASFRQARSQDRSKL